MINSVTHLINLMICVFSFMACAESISSHVHFILLACIMYTLCFKLQSVHSAQHDFVYFICSMCALNCFVQIINFTNTYPN